MADTDAFESFDENQSRGRGYESDSSRIGMSDYSVERERKKRKFVTPSPNKSYLEAWNTPSTVRQGPGSGFGFSHRKPTRPTKPQGPQITSDYIIIKARGIKLASENPIKIQKYISKDYGVVKNIRPTRTGDILVQCMDLLQLKLLMKTTKLGEWVVNCTRPQSVENTVGCIYNVPLDVSEEDIVYALNDYGVNKATRLTYFNTDQGKRLPSKTIKLNFKLPQLPSVVCIGFSRHPVRLYIPKPVQCFQCQEYGHMSSDCKNKKVCVKCSLSHEGECTSDTLKCVNCKGSHQSSDKKCPKRVEKQKALKKSKEMKITVGEATKLVKQEQKPTEKPQVSHTSQESQVQNPPETNVTVSEFVSILTTTIAKIVKCPTERLSADNIAKYVSEVTHIIINHKINPISISEKVEQYFCIEM